MLALPGVYLCVVNICRKSFPAFLHYWGGGFIQCIRGEKISFEITKSLNHQGNKFLFWKPYPDHLDGSDDEGAGVWLY